MSGGSLITSLTDLFADDSVRSTEAATSAPDSAAPDSAAPGPVSADALADTVSVDQPIAPADTAIVDPVDENATSTTADNGATEAPSGGFLARVVGIFRGAKRAEPTTAAMPSKIVVAMLPAAPEPDLNQAALPGSGTTEPTATDSAALSPPTDRPTAASATDGMRAYRRGDFQVALANWLPLAQTGDPDAQYLVGGLFLTGAGVPPDLVRAHMWWSLSSAEGHPRANRDKGALRGRMSPEQLVESERLASTWRAAH